MKEINEIKDWLQLWKVPRVGAKTYQKLLSAFGSPAAVFDANAEALKQAGFSELLISNIQKSKDSVAVQADLDWLQQADNHYIVTVDCADYPKMLKQTSNPPPLLYVRGDFSVLNDPQIAIVGSRNPTQGGLAAAYDFSNYLGKTGLCITSGLALGIDGKAHQGALDAGAPTIAVIATGIDRVYPARHRDLAHKIVQNGAIVSEFPIGTQPKAENFPRRNRIISGLSYGTLVVEAALRSGSLITARLAMEQNREVFAIPGSIHNSLARGCHQLIRQGAKLVETAQDILEEMVIELGDNISIEDTPPQQISLESDESTQLSTDDSNMDMITLLDSMGYDPVPVDQLVVLTGFSPEAVSSMLLMLELNNKISSNGGGTYTRLK